MNNHKKEADRIFNEFFEILAEGYEKDEPAAQFAHELLDPYAKNLALWHIKEKIKITGSADDYRIKDEIEKL